jgi:type I restriction enzyme S subunit
MIQKEEFIATPMGKMPFDWKKHQLSEVSEFITKGATPTTYGFKWQDSGITFLRSECVSEQGYSESGIAFISKEAHDAMERSKIKGGDILISITGNVGRIAVYPLDKAEGNINQHIARVRIIKKEIATREFIYYQINQRNYRNYYLGIITGAAYPQLSLKQIRETSVYLPPLQTQKRIADILSNYDDLIENNLKRIKLLEQAAQNIYKEWFVHLRLPGYENTPINEETGLPVGWEEKALGDIITKLESGSRPKGGIDKTLQEGVPSVGAESVRGLGYFDFSKTKYVKTDFFEKMRKGILEDRDILIYKDGAYIGRSTLFQDNFPFEQCSINEHIFLIHTKDEELQYYLYFTLHSDLYFEKMQNLNSNAAQPGINQKKIKTLPVITPTSDLLLKFDSIVEPIVKQIYQLAKMNLELKTGRDILLPRLMNRTIEVE